MRIEVSPSPCEGVNTPFSLKFEEWLGREIRKGTTRPEAFIKKYGKDWKLILCLQPKRRIKHARLVETKLVRRDKEVYQIINVPAKNAKSPDPAAYAPWIEKFLQAAVKVLRDTGFDPSGVETALPRLVKRFASDLRMIEPCFLEGFFFPRSPEPPVSPSATLKPKVRNRKRNLPKWKMPPNIAKRVENEDGMWEEERFDPILLTVMSGTEYRGRAIPLAWQIEFDPSDDRLESASERLEAAGVEPDGDGWSGVIAKEFRKRYPKLAGELHSDSESSTCVLWVESERACKLLVELVWFLMFARLPLSIMFSFLRHRKGEKIS